MNLGHAGLEILVVIAAVIGVIWFFFGSTIEAYLLFRFGLIPAALVLFGLSYLHWQKGDKFGFFVNLLFGSLCILTAGLKPGRR